MPYGSLVSSHRRWRNRNGGVKTAGWWTLRRRSTLHHAVKDERVTVQGPVKKPQMDCMSHRGEEGEGGRRPICHTTSNPQVFACLEHHPYGFGFISDNKPEQFVVHDDWTVELADVDGLRFYTPGRPAITVDLPQGHWMHMRVAFRKPRDSYFAGAAMSTGQRTTISHTLQWHLIKC